MSRLFLALGIVCCSLASLRADAGSIWSTLTPQQQDQLSSGQQIMLEEEVADNPWPRFVVYHLVKGSSEKVAAIFWDCELDSKYIPNCLSVRMLSRPAPSIHIGEYTLKMPFFLPNEVYVSSNVLQIPSTGVYEISWNVVQARYIQGSKGNMKIEQHGANGEESLIRYSNLVIPGSKFAGMLRTKAGNQVVESVKAFATQVECELRDSPELVDRQVLELQKASGLPAPAAK